MIDDVNGLIAKMSQKMATTVPAEESTQNPSESAMDEASILSQSITASSKHELPFDQPPPVAPSDKGWDAFSGWRGHVASASEVTARMYALAKKHGDVKFFNNTDVANKVMYDAYRANKFMDACRAPKLLTSVTNTKSCALLLNSAVRTHESSITDRNFYGLWENQYKPDMDDPSAIEKASASVLRGWAK